MRTPKETQPVDPKVARAAQMSLLHTMADTTWRMLVPSAVFVLGGIYGDLTLHTKPWLTLLSVALGLAVSARLIINQMKVR